nr:hypothetical protein [bacterium]
MGKRDKAMAQQMQRIQVEQAQAIENMRLQLEQARMRAQQAEQERDALSQETARIMEQRAYIADAIICADRESARIKEAARQEAEGILDSAREKAAQQELRQQQMLQEYAAQRDNARAGLVALRSRLQELLAHIDRLIAQEESPEAGHMQQAEVDDMLQSLAQALGGEYYAADAACTQQSAAGDACQGAVCTPQGGKEQPLDATDNGENLSADAEELPRENGDEAGAQQNGVPQVDAVQENGIGPVESEKCPPLQPDGKETAPSENVDKQPEADLNGGERAGDGQGEWSVGVAVKPSSKLNDMLAKSAQIQQELIENLPNDAAALEAQLKQILSDLDGMEK